MHQEIVNLLLQRLDSPDEKVQVVTVRETKTWPAHMLETLCKAGLLSPSTPSNVYTCTSCTEEHDEEVMVVESPAGSALRMYIQCPSVGRVQVDPEELRQWQLIPNGLVNLVSRLMEIPAPYQEIVPGRIWRMGVTTLGKISREVVMIRGLCWDDGHRILEKITNYTSIPIVLVLPYHVPGDTGICFLPLSRVLHLTNGVISIDRVTVELITSAWPSPLPVAPKPDGKKMFSHSEDFRSWQVNDDYFVLTTRQTQVAEVLFEAYENKTPELSSEYILDRIGSESDSATLRDIFRNSKAWNNLIVKGSRRDMYRLNL
jgi:hypothetical protein